VRRRHLLPGRDDLVACRQDGDDRPAPDVHLGDANSGEYAGIATRQQLPAPQHRLACRDVGTGERHAAAGCDRTCDAQAVAARFRVFHHHHGVGAARHHASGRNGDRLACPDNSCWHHAGVDFLGSESDRPRAFLGRAERVLRDDREAVDIGAIERRDVNGGEDVGGEDAPERRVDGNPLDAAWCQVERGAEAPLGFIAIEDLEELLLLTHRARRRPLSLRRSPRCRRRQ
jgi:hypothetical protein